MALAALACASVCRAEPPPAAASPGLRLVAAARAQIGVTIRYDSTYRRMDYPNGDVPVSEGVCTDVIIRALREQGIDLQRAVHQDMAAHFSAYPKKWALRRPDKNIDHRRVPNLMTYFQRRGHELPIARDATSYAAGDVVTWHVGYGLVHIGLVSDRASAQGTPLIIHNMGLGTVEEDILFTYDITGHYRVLGAPMVP